MTKELIRRRDAAEAAVKRYNGRPFKWGRADCVRLAAFALRQQHRPVSLVKAGSYASEAAALKALERAGFASLMDAVDAQGLTRIPPAACLPGDLMGLPTDEPGPWLALTVALGNGRVLGFHGGFGRVLAPRSEALAQAVAWRV